MSDNAEMGEQPADPATRSGVGVGAVPDDYAEGVAEQQMETTGAADDSTEPITGESPTAKPTPFADSDAAALEMTDVNDWGTGPEQPQDTPSAERGEG
jgi:hypothetical protein